MRAAFFLLALPSIAVLAALVRYVAANFGARQAALFFGALTLYGAARGFLIQNVLSPALGSPPPYLMNLPIVGAFGVSLQELVGWGVAVALAWRLSEGLLRRLGLGASPYRVAALAAVVMAAICLSVESAAISSGWWVWTLRMPASGPFRVPPVALLDWAFVAFDFLLPALLFAAPARRWERLASTALFPLHFLAHLWVEPLPGPLPVSGWALVHVGIAGWALTRALAACPESPSPGDSGLTTSNERLTWIPPVAAMVVACCSLAASLAVGHSDGAALGAVPLVLIAVAGAALPERKAMSTASLGALQAAVVAALLAVAYLAAVAVPGARRTQAFEDALRAGAARLNAGDVAGAEREFRRGVSLRPDHPAGPTALAFVALRRGARDQARTELLAALRLHPVSRDALQVLATLDLEAGRFAEARGRASLGLRAYPASEEFKHLAAEVERLSRAAGAARQP